MTKGKSFKWSSNPYRLMRVINAELPVEKRRLRRRAQICREFFLEPSPIIGLLGINGANVLRKADKVIDRWIAGETIRLKKSCRGVNFEYEEGFEDE